MGDVGISLGGPAGTLIYDNNISETTNGMQFSSYAKGIEVYGNTVNATNNALYLYHATPSNILTNVVIGHEDPTKGNELIVPKGKTAITIKPFNRDKSFATPQLIFKSNKIEGNVVNSGAKFVEFNNNTIKGRLLFTELLGYESSDITLDSNEITSDKNGISFRTSMENSQIVNNRIMFQENCFGESTDTALANTLTMDNNTCTELLNQTSD